MERPPYAYPQRRNALLSAPSCLNDTRQANQPAPRCWDTGPRQKWPLASISGRLASPIGQLALNAGPLLVPSVTITHEGCYLYVGAQITR